MSWLPIELWKKIIIQYVNFRECRQKDFALVCKLWMEIVNGAQYSYIIPSHMTKELLWKYYRGINWYEIIMNHKIGEAFICRYNVFDKINRCGVSLSVSEEFVRTHISKFRVGNQMPLIGSGVISECIIDEYLTNILPNERTVYEVSPSDGRTGYGVSPSDDKYMTEKNILLSAVSYLPLSQNFIIKYLNKFDTTHKTQLVIYRRIDE